VHGGFAEWPINGAIVMDNDVNMQAPEGAVFGAYSAGIEIRGFAQGNVVLNKPDSEDAPEQPSPWFPGTRVFPKTICSAGMTSKASSHRSPACLWTQA